MFLEIFARKHAPKPGSHSGETGRHPETIGLHDVSAQDLEVGRRREGHPLDNKIDHVDVDVDDDDDDDDNDDDDDADAEQDDANHHLPQRPRFGHHLSKTTLFDGLRSCSWPPKWFQKGAAFFHPAASKTDDDYILNYRHTPIISGILIPFSILLEIASVTDHWYTKTLDDNTTVIQKNAVILDIGLAFSLLCAVIANICLVIRFLERRVKTMTILCVVFLTIHDIINVIAVIVSSVHTSNSGFTLGQSFWMAICSTVVSLITNITLVVDLIQTPDFSKSGSGLTPKQRSLLITVIIQLCYVGFGALFTSFLQHLSFINALYFTVVTIETIGFGDITPNSKGSRLFICFYACFGILNLAMLFSIARETISEALEVSYRLRLDNIRKRRRLAKMQKQVKVRWLEAVERRLREAGAPIWVKDEYPSSRKVGVKETVAQAVNRVCHLIPGCARRHQRQLGYGSEKHAHGMHLNLDALTRTQLEASAMEAGVPLNTLLPPWFRHRDELETEAESQQLTLTHVRMGRMVASLGRFVLALDEWSRSPPTTRQPQTNPFNHSMVETNKPNSTSVKVDQTTHFQDNTDQTSRSKFQISLSPLCGSNSVETRRVERKVLFVRVTVACFLFILFWTIGSAIFTATEGWSYGTAMYFCFIAFTTIGYGDLTPQTPAGRSVFVVWALLAIGTISIFISVLLEVYSFHYKRALNPHVFDKAVRRYRQRTRIQQLPLPVSEYRNGQPPACSPPLPPLTYAHNPSASSLNPDTQSQSHSALNDRIQQHLEVLPLDILRHAKTFQEYILYFTGVRNAAKKSNAGGKQKEIFTQMPDGLKRLLNDIADTDMIEEQIKAEILHDDNVRQTFFTLSLEKWLRDIVDAAETVLDDLEARDSSALPDTMHDILDDLESQSLTDPSSHAQAADSSTTAPRVTRRATGRGL